jgi:hypothetical protein
MFIQNKFIKKINWLVVGPIIILFLASIYYVVTTSNYVRFWADDFCSSVLLRNNGYWQSQIIWWKGWTGRYSYIAFLDLVELFGLVGAQILPIILFVLYSASTLLLFSFSVPVGLLMVVIFLLNSPNIIQSFYWMTGSLNYFAPFILLNLFLSLLFFKSKKYFSILSFILLFVASGFSESFAVANLLFLIFLYIVLPKASSKRLIVVGFVSTILSLGLMFLAPGNAVRSATVSHPDGLIDLITKSFIYSKWYLIHLLYIKEFVLSALAIFVGAFIFLDKNKKYFENPKKVIILSLLFMVAITFAVVGLTYQAMNWEPPMRVMTIVSYMIIYALVIFSAALFQLVSKFVSKSLAKIIFVILIVLLTFQLNYHWNVIRNEIVTYANGWDAIETKLISAPNGSTVNVGELTPVGKLDGFKENKGWVSSCIAGYYYLDSLEYNE